MRRAAPTILLITALVSGCAESQLGGHLLYMTPYKIEALECSELKKKADAATSRTKELDQLRASFNKIAEKAKRANTSGHETETDVIAITRKKHVGANRS